MSGLTPADLRQLAMQADRYNIVISVQVGGLHLVAHTGHARLVTYRALQEARMPLVLVEETIGVLSRC